MQHNIVAVQKSYFLDFVITIILEMSRVKKSNFFFLFRQQFLKRQFFGIVPVCMLGIYKFE